MAEYYGQRAGAGLIIAEATAIDRKGLGWMNAPGLYSDTKTDFWELTSSCCKALNASLRIESFSFEKCFFKG